MFEIEGFIHSGFLPGDPRESTGGYRGASGGGSRSSEDEEQVRQILPGAGASRCMVVPALALAPRACLAWFLPGAAAESSRLICLVKNKKKERVKTLL